MSEDENRAEIMLITRQLELCKKTEENKFRH